LVNLSVDLSAGPADGLRLPTAPPTGRATEEPNRPRGKLASTGKKVRLAQSRTSPQGELCFPAARRALVAFTTDGGWGAAASVWLVNTAALAAELKLHGKPIPTRKNS